MPAVVDRAAVGRALSLVADITTILDGWAATAPAQLKAGGLGIQVVRRAAKAIGRSEVDTARLIEVAAAAGLVSIDAASDAALPLPAYDQWSDLDVADRWAHLVGAWLRWDLHVGLAGRARRQAQAHPAPARAHARGQRRPPPGPRPRHPGRGPARPVGHLRAGEGPGHVARTGGVGGRPRLPGDPGGVVVGRV